MQIAIAHSTLAAPRTPLAAGRLLAVTLVLGVALLLVGIGA